MSIINVISGSEIPSLMETVGKGIIQLESMLTYKFRGGTLYPKGYNHPFAETGHPESEGGLA